MRAQRALMFTFRFILTLLMLAGCSGPPDVTTGNNVHTGRSFAFAKPQRLYADAVTVLYAAPAFERGPDSTGYHILLSVARNDLNYPKITEAWSFGTRLAYSKKDRRRNFCHPVCDREETGTIHLSRAAFETYAQTGFAFQLLGKRGAYDGVISAEAFQFVLNQIKI